MTILVTHEMGHYVTARRHGLDVSLPYFIPLPFIGIGTLGAVIRMRRPIQGRDALADVGMSGPLAGLVVAVPLLVIGLVLSPVTEIREGPAILEGNSVLYLGLKLLVKGQLLPSAGWASRWSTSSSGRWRWPAWVGLLVTFINLIPSDSSTGARGRGAASAIGTSGSAPGCIAGWRSSVAACWCGWRSRRTAPGVTSGARCSTASSARCRGWCGCCFWCSCDG
jgi:hypothetical protein